MDVEEIAVLLYLISKKRNKKRKQYWVHPLLRERLTMGLFHTYFTDLQQHDDKFFNYLRMSKSSFEELLRKLSSSITGTVTKFRLCISAKEKLVATLSGRSGQRLNTARKCVASISLAAAAWCSRWPRAARCAYSMAISY
ncbi:unnamed protein product [Leptidea sinapis]|uniref:Uncharacterized protein n=1 Tax=Leptidea sinapis TaxID=189913 RepID=A0A5E4R0R6_9NEOP|nr:unnamed protein product [Leptidea sinapis]